MKTRRLWLFHFLRTVGIAAFLGSIFAMIVLGRSHDFSQNWNEIVTSRSDILRIIWFVNLPGLFLYFIIDLFEHWAFLFKRKISVFKLILNVTVLLITTFVILPASLQMVDIAKEALSTNGLSDTFYAMHLREDIFGPINMILFLTSMGIGLQPRLYTHA